METTGVNNLTAFYEGDATYTESVSANIPITISNFALASPGDDCRRGIGCHRTGHSERGQQLHHAHQLSPAPCPSSLTAIGMFCGSEVDHRHRAGFAHRQHHTCRIRNQQANGASRMARRGRRRESRLCLFCSAFPRRTARRGTAMLLAGFMAILFTVIGCGGTAKIDPGTPKGTYTVVVTATAGSGSSQYQTSVNVPITIQ